MGDTITHPQPFAAGKKIIIAGAGLSGLSFAISLHQQHTTLYPTLAPPSITILERDPQNFGEQRKGYSITIRADHPSRGLQTLKNLGLLDKVLKESVTDGHGKFATFCYWDENWKLLKRFEHEVPEGLPVSATRIARDMLRKILLDAFPGEIRWGTTCTDVEPPNQDRQIGVRLSNGEIEYCDLLISADGARSKLRSSIRPNDNLQFVGVVWLRGISRFADGIPEPVSRDFGLNVGGKGNSFFASPIDGGNLVWSVSYMAEGPREVSKQPHPIADAESLLREVLQRCACIAEPLETIVRATDVNTLEVDNAWDKQPFSHADAGMGNVGNGRVVFIGDANHAMSAFSGNGANMALADGWDLAEQLWKFERLEDALRVYDGLSVPRAREVIETSHETIKAAHNVVPFDA